MSGWKRLWAGLCRFARERGGAVAVEMAALAPVLLVLLLGTADLGWRLLAEYRLGRAAASLADLVARVQSLEEEDVTNAFDAARNLLAPFDLERDGAALVSGVEALGSGQPVVRWQRELASALDLASRVGRPGSRADLGDLRLEPGEAVVVAEVYLRFRPLVGWVLADERLLYRRWVAMPRYGTLDDPSS